MDFLALDWGQKIVAFFFVAFIGLFALGIFAQFLFTPLLHALDTIMDAIDALRNKGRTTDQDAQNEDRPGKEVGDVDLIREIEDVEDEQLSEREYETSLQLIGLSFQERNKWRFSDGASPFFADIADQNFLQKINSHQVVFAKDDIIRAKILERQKLTKDGIKTERSLTKVLGHRSAALQLGLPIVMPEE